MPPLLGALLKPIFARGGLGFARFAFEITHKEALLTTFHTVIVACASGITLGGLTGGFKLLSLVQQSAFSNSSAGNPLWLPRQIIGIDCFANIAGEPERLVSDVARGTALKIGLSSGAIQLSDIPLMTDEMRRRMVCE